MSLHHEQLTTIKLAPFVLRPLDSDEENYLDKMNHEMCMRLNTHTHGVNKSNIVMDTIIHIILIFRNVCVSAPSSILILHLRVPSHLLSRFLKTLPYPLSPE